MKRILLCAICAICGLTACSVTRIARTEPDGTAFRATNARAFWKSSGIEVTYGRTNTNVAATARIDASGSDAAAIEAAAAGAARGATGNFPKP